MNPDQTAPMGSVRSGFIVFTSMILFDFILYIPANNVSVMFGTGLPGSLASTKQGLMCLVQGHNAVMLVRVETTTLRS